MPKPRSSLQRSRVAPRNAKQVLPCRAQQQAMRQALPPADFTYLMQRTAQNERIVINAKGEGVAICSLNGKQLTIAAGVDLSLVLALLATWDMNVESEVR